MAMVLDFFVQKTLGKLTDIAEQEACKVLGVKNEIKKLQRTMTRISSFLQDAERKRHTDAAIDTGVKELKDIMYDADDIIDLCMFAGGKLLELQRHPSSSAISLPLSLLSSCFSCVKYRHKIANRIQELNDRLKEIADNNQVIPRLESSSNQGSQVPVVRSRGQGTSPIQVDSDVVGRQIEDAANDIIQWILEDDRKQCQVYGVVGMGGIGKTTLAYKIFNDQRIINNFSTRIWLYVSKNYSEPKLFKELIRETGGNDDGAESTAELGKKFVTALRSNNRKILLVLDDVWSEDVWNNLLKNPIVSSGVIGKILITSRYVNVGRAMGATIDHIHHVERIDGEGGWELLRKIVFQDRDESIVPILKDVGTRIVAKCDGLPLAIKVIAGILFHKEKTQREWEKILESNLWQMNQIDDEVSRALYPNYAELPRALYLSYQDLPYELKPCFLSCALLRGSTSYFQVIRFWMAEGFILEHQNILMEELGEDYYMELISRNLLQSDPEVLDNSYFVMHDLLRALAANLMEGITLSEGETLNTNNSLIKIRRLSMLNKIDILTLPSAIIEQKCLRVLLVHNSPQTKTIQDDTFKILRYLRFLDLSDISTESIPDSIGKLLHLRCLYLDRSKILRLPESIVNLVNLRTLSVWMCRSLDQLPNGITRLCNLRCLSLYKTPLKHVPKGIGNLRNINLLEGFAVGHDESANGEGCDLEELQFLSNLRFLEVQKLERASIQEGATVLANLTFLRRLMLRWNISEEEDSDEEANINVAPSANDEEDNINAAASASDEEEIIKRAESVCSQLIPPSSLEFLCIFNFPGGRFPGWLMSTPLGASFPHLASIKIFNSPLCTVLPPLGQLPQLKYLAIRRALGVKKIGPAFLGSYGFSRFPAFPKLEFLEFEDMPNWEEWELCAEQEEEKVGDERNHLKLFPNLTKCYQIGCSRLIVLPEAFYQATNFQVLDVQGCQKLKRISNIPRLKRLFIEDCSSLEQVGNADMLQSLYLTCPSTKNEFLPHWLLNLLPNYKCQSQHSLRYFQMTCSLPLLKSCLKGKQNWHIIEQIPEACIITMDNEHSMRYTKDPPFYNTTVVADSDEIDQNRSVS